MGVPGLGGYAGLWQYDASSMYPNNIIGVQNDTSLYNLTADVDRLEQYAAKLNEALTPVLRQNEAKIAAQWRQMLNTTNGNNNVLAGLLNGSLSTTSTTGNNGLSGILNGNSGKVKYTRIKRYYITSTLDRMGAGLYESGRMNEVLKLKDAEGNDRNITLKDRLKELVDEYNNNPDDSALSKKNFEKLWDVVSKYAHDGYLANDDDIAALKKIAMMPGEDYDNEDDSVDETDETDKAEGKKDKKDKKDKVEPHEVERSANYDNGHKADMSTDAQIAFNSLDGLWTDKDDLRRALSHTDKYNIIEFLEAFDDLDSNGEGFIKKFWDDFDRYDNDGQHWYQARDNAKPFFDPKKRLSPIKKLAERADDILKLENTKLSEEEKEALKSAKEALIEATNNLENGIDKDAHIEAFEDLVEKIKEAEKVCYGNEN